MQGRVRTGQLAGAVVVAAGLVVVGANGKPAAAHVDVRTDHRSAQARGAAQPGTYRASMPSLSSDSGVGGSSLQAGRPLSGNLGTFDIVINPTPALAANPAALAAFNRAAMQWESFIADPITVNIDADLAPLGAGILGSTGAVTLTASFDTIRNAMVADAGDESDDAVTTFLPTAAQFTGRLPAGFAFDGNVQASKANLKALGFSNLDGSFGASDGDILFSSNFAFDYDNSDGISAGQFDFESVAAHEIGHLLGFFSDVDYVDFIRSQNQTANNVQPTTLDLFRFDDDPANDPTDLLTFTSKPRSLVPGNVEHFDQILAGFGGDIEILMSTGDATGDGQQASHWKDNLGLGLMDPTLSFGQIVPLSFNDLRAMDLIGYEMTVPEPGTVTLLVGAGAFAMLRRRRS